MRQLEDSEIIDLYWNRQEQALEETDRKYGSYCWTIAHNVLRSREDAEECVNDTWLRAWNSIPPQRPSIFSSFLGTITRNLSLDVWKAKHTGKRGGGRVTLAVEELADCIPDGTDVEKTVADAELTRIIDRFLRSLPEKECYLFLRRYWYVDSISEIAHRYKMAEGTVKASLHRTRKKLREHLEQKGVQL